MPPFRPFSTRPAGWTCVVHNAGHLFIGYVEAFTAEDIAHLFDVNVLERSARQPVPLPAAIPRERRCRDLILHGHASTVDPPTFPRASARALEAPNLDVLAATTAYEVGQFGIETVIVMPGAFTRGTEHFPNASRASERQRDRAGVRGARPAGRPQRGGDRGPVRVAGRGGPAGGGRGDRAHPRPPRGAKPPRSVVDFTRSHVEEVNAVARREQEDFVTRMGYAELLTLKQ